jgi:glutamate racemase
MMQQSASLIGIYDSGMGGLSVMRAVRMLLPTHNLLYLADTAFCPYGPRPVEEVRDRALACTGWLIEQGVQMVVVACNTASSAALELLRAEYLVPIVGMEPGVKPAVAATRSGQVGILATSGTLTGQRFASLVQRFASRVAVQTVPCPGLVERVELGDLDGPQTREVLEACLHPLQAEGVDTIVLGCTHFHFVAPLIREVAGPEVTVIDTALAVARQVARVAAQIGLSRGERVIRFATSGDPASIAPVFVCLWGTELRIECARM